MHSRVLRTAAEAAVFFLILTPALHATAPPDGISVSPVRVDLGAAQRSAAVTITNGNAGRVVQVEGFRWRRSQGEDLYTPADDLIVNPPLFKLAPGAKQVVRIGFAAPAAAPRAGAEERAYRVYFQEVPEQTSAAAGGTRLQMVLRLGVPVFVAPDPIRTELRWSAKRTADGFSLQLNNAGNAHARLSDLVVTLPAAAPADSPKPLANAPALRYVFPGETSVWTFQLSGPIAARVLQLSAISESGTINAEIPLEAP